MKTLLFILILTVQQLFALISIVPVEIGNSPGISGKIEAGLDTKRGNTVKDFYKTSAKVAYDNNSSFVSWIEVSGEYGKANGVEDTNKIFIHARHIHKLTKNILRAEFFVQSQEDRFKAIKQRRLAGAGLRFNLFENPIGGKGYFGIGGFYEYIKYLDTTLDPTEDNARLNTYFAYTIKFAEDSTLAYTLYYQPKFNEFSDHVISNKLELKLHIYLQLFLKFTVSYDVDSVPPNDIESDYDFSQSTTFVLNF